MWTKLFFATLFVFTAITGFTVYYSASWLASITVPADAFAGYEYFRNTSWWLLGITTAVLLVLANIVIALTRSALALWVTFGYFVVFVLSIGFLLPLSAIDFLRDNGYAPETSNYLSPFVAIFLAAGFGVLVYANLLLMRRIRGGSEDGGSRGDRDPEHAIAAEPDEILDPRALGDRESSDQ